MHLKNGQKIIILKFKRGFMVKISKNKFKSNLSLLQYKVTQEGATEPPFSHSGFEKDT